MIEKIKINFYPLNAKLRRFFDLLINLFDEGIMVLKTSKKIYMLRKR